MPPEVLNTVEVAKLFGPRVDGEMLYVRIDHLGLLSFAQIIVAKDPTTGKEVVITGRELYERMDADDPRRPGPMTIVMVEHDSDLFDELVHLVNRIHLTVDVDDAYAEDLDDDEDCEFEEDDED